MPKATITLAGQAVEVDAATPTELAESIQALLIGAGTNGTATAAGIYTPATAGQLVQAIQPEALRMLAMIARDAPAGSIEGIRKEMGLATSSEASGRLSSIGFARRALNLPRPYRPRKKMYEMDPGVAEIFREATRRELKRRKLPLPQGL
jgi:phospholipase/lecithinase/hemolysin